MCRTVPGPAPGTRLSGEVIELAAEFRLYRPRGGGRAGRGRLHDAERLGAVAAGAPVAPLVVERQFVARELVGQSVHVRRATVALGRRALDIG